MPDYDDLNDHPFAEFQAGENYVSDSEKTWLAWVKKVEAIVGHGLDGNQETDGYSLDYAYAAFETKATPEEYAKEIKEGTS